MKKPQKPEPPRISFETTPQIKKAIDMATAESSSSIKELLEKWIVKHPTVKKHLAA